MSVQHQNNNDLEVEKNIPISIRGKPYSAHIKTWKCKENPVAAVTFIHGLGEHILRYNHVFPIFSKNGIQVTAIDLPGHGQTTGGAKGDIVSVEDVQAFVQEAIRLNHLEGKKHFIMGHSMGGLLALTHGVLQGEDSNIAGYLVSAPALGLPKPPSSMLRAVVNILTKFSLFAEICLDNGLDLNNLSRDSKVIEDYKKDPFVHGKVSLRTAASLINMGETLSENPNLFKKPILVMHGSADTLTSFEKSKDFIEKLEVADKTFIPHEGFFHELHNEPEKEMIINTYVHWILDRLTLNSNL